MSGRSNIAKWGAVVAVVMLTIGFSEALAAPICGPHAYIERITRQPNGRLYYHCKCRPGFTEIAPRTTVSGNPPQWPGCQRKERAAAYDCDVCYRKLIADVQKGWASARLRTYVNQALSGYANCKLKARGICMQGDILARTIRRGCDGFVEEDAYRACIGRAVP